MQLVLSLRDVHEAVRRIDLKGRQLQEESGNVVNSRIFAPRANPASIRTDLGRAETVLLEIKRVLQRERQPSSGNFQRFKTFSRLQQIAPQVTVVKPYAQSSGGPQLTRQFLDENRVHPTPEKPHELRGAHREISAASLVYVLEVRRLLFLTEFIILLNYVGVFIPLVFWSRRQTYLLL